MLMNFSQVQSGSFPLITSTPKKYLNATENSPVNRSNEQPNGSISDVPLESVSPSAKSPTSPVTNHVETSNDAAAAHAADSANVSASENEETPTLSIDCIPSTHSGNSTYENSIEERNRLKHRLVRALEELIPYNQRLSLRLMVHYTVDGDKTDCIIIDETLTHGSNDNTALNASELSDSGCIADQYSDPVTKKRRLCKETNVLDLSVHIDKDEHEMELAMNNQSEEMENVAQAKLASVAKAVALNEQSVSNAASTSTISNGHLPSVFPCNNLPFLDPNFLNLLPLLQQQQQQQQQQRQQNNNQFEPSNSEVSNEVPARETSQSSSSSGSPETAESILFKELQALIRATNTAGVSLSNSIFNTTKQSVLSKNYFTNQGNTNFLNVPTNSTSVVGLPLLNTVTPDQLTALQALLPSYPLLTTPNFTSLNVTPTTLFNLKDTTSGLGTVGIMPTNNTTRNISNPVANLLGQLALPQVNHFSLRNLSNLLATNASIKSGQLVNQNTTISLSHNTGNYSTLADDTTRNDAKQGEFSLTDLNLSSSEKHNSRSVFGYNTDSYSKADTSTNGASNINGNYSLSNTNGTNNGNQFIFGRRPAHTRRFVCNQCRENFSSLAELNRHTLETHNSFKCTICSAHFTQRSNLQRHSLKHVGFKPFTCNLCKKEYYRKDHLVRHIEVTHPNHDPKMNITVHLTSSECLDYLDRLHAEKQSPSSEEVEQTDTQPQDNGELKMDDDAASHTIEEEHMQDEVDDDQLESERENEQPSEM